MNIKSALKNGMKKIKGKLKIKITSDGVVVKGKKCKTAKSLFENVKEIAQKDKNKDKKYGSAWNEIAIKCRSDILTTSFTADKKSEEFYKTFIKTFKNKAVTPSTLDAFYDEQIKNYEQIKNDEEITPKDIINKIIPVYAALSFYAMREKSLVNSSDKKIKFDSVTFLGHVFNSPKEMLKDAKKTVDTAITDLEKIKDQIFKPYNDAINNLEEKYKVIFNNYANNIDFTSKFSEAFSTLSGFIKSANYFKKNLPQSIDKKNLSKEYAAFENLGKHTNEFINKLGGQTYDTKVVDGDSTVYLCAAFYYTSKQWYDTGNAYLLVIQGKNEEAKKLISNVNKNENALKDVEELKKMTDELNEVANCENILEAKKVAEEHGRKISIKNLIASAPNLESPVLTEDTNKGTNKKRKRFFGLRKSKKSKTQTQTQTQMQMQKRKDLTKSAIFLNEQKDNRNKF